MIISKKISWLLLTVFISFDNIFSYIAIVYHGMREWNPTTAFFVSITPLFYFISIPLTLLFLYLISKLVGWFEEKTDKSKLSLREFTESLLLACFAIAWGVGVTSFNFITLLRGFSPLRIDYRIFLITGVLLALAYVLYENLRMKKGK